MGQVMDENSEGHRIDNGVREKACVGKGNGRQGCEVCHQCTHPTMATLPQPWNWFKLQPHVADSKASKTLSMVRGGNALLGNRYKNRYGARHVWCPLCKVKGVRVKLTESHVILSCPAVLN